MLGLIIGITVVAALVCCAGIVLTLCARAPRAEEPAAQLSRLDQLDSLTDRTTQPSYADDQVTRPERVA